MRWMVGRAMQLLSRIGNEATRHVAYPNYSAAFRTCGDGYENSDLATTIMYKTQRLEEIDAKTYTYEWLAPVVAAIAYLRAPGRPVRLLDFGGAFGAHRKAVISVFPDLATRWAIIETPLFVKKGQEMAADDLNWFEDVAHASDWLGGIDLALFSGVIQCVEDPAKLLEKAISLNSPAILWQRTCLSFGAQIITVQKSRLKDNGPPGPLPDGLMDRTVRYPKTYFPKDAFLRAHQGYDLRFHLKGDENIIAGQETEEGSAYFFVRRNQ